ncbi:MAG: rhamnogalacturonan acetylesterase [Bacteroidales bacterium]|nr:rhamnogalacturonan acetylesterase [Bacteroidales bacterium]
MNQQFAKQLAFIVLFSLFATWGNCQLIAPVPDSFRPVRIKFDFGNGKTEPGYLKVTGNTVYSKDKGYGFVSELPLKDINRKGKNALTSDFCTGTRPFYFVKDLPEGNYEIKITLGDRRGKTATTIKAESRRLMIEDVKTSKGEFRTETIMVNVRTPKIDNQKGIRLKKRELNYLNWDDKLTLEFSGERPCICAIEIKEIKDVLTVFLAGNSTVTDQENEPWASWGQMLPVFFKPAVVVANYAESGEALKSFEASLRLEKILSKIKPGDYLFIEFGHNDQKPQSSSFVEPFTGYKEMLKKYIHKVRELGAKPVLITPIQRRNFDEKGKVINTHGDYPEAVRQTAKEESVPLIDLHLMSTKLYEALGTEGSKKALVHYPAGTFPGQEKELADNTHHSTYGAYQLAKCIVEGIKKEIPALAGYLKSVSGYDPGNPDRFTEWKLTVSPTFESIKPDGY